MLTILMWIYLFYCYQEMFRFYTRNIIYSVKKPTIQAENPWSKHVMIRWSTISASLQI